MHLKLLSRLSYVSAILVVYILIPLELALGLEAAHPGWASCISRGRSGWN
ncbi:hypothetical protein OROMI_014510 [Orobanche minor]